jgi:hypothetical protein
LDDLSKARHCAVNKMVDQQQSHVRQVYVRECDSPESPQNENDALLRDCDKGAPRASVLLCFNADDLEDTVV